MTTSASEREELVAKVRVGQVWADGDPRMTGRKLRVVEVVPGSTNVEPYAVMTVVANARNVGQDNVGRTRRIKLRRLVSSGARGYELASDPVAIQTTIDTINEMVGDQHS